LNTFYGTNKRRSNLFTASLNSGQIDTFHETLQPLVIAHWLEYRKSGELLYVWQKSRFYQFICRPIEFNSNAHCATINETKSSLIRPAGSAPVLYRYCGGWSIVRRFESQW